VLQLHVEVQLKGVMDKLSAGTDLQESYAHINKFTCLNNKRYHAEVHYFKACLKYLQGTAVLKFQYILKINLIYLLKKLLSYRFILHGLSKRCEFLFLKHILH